MAEDLVAIAKFTNNVEAQVGKSILDGAGIRCRIFDDNVSTLLSYLGSLTSARLMVRREDAEKALEVLRTELPENESGETILDD
jgi:hypothetical protein